MREFQGIIHSTDELTGLMGKQTFYSRAQEQVDNYSNDSEFAFIFFDIYNFKIYNANYGFEKGDELLSSIGKIISEAFPGQLVSRFSGDHFVVCANSSNIISIIKSIREKIKLYQQNINIELKAGIYVFDGSEKNIIKCCDRARMACISIKKNYDSEYKFYDDELEGSLRHKQKILDSIDEAIEKKYIKVYYQPIIRTLSGKVCAWEALVRWIDPEKGPIYPNDFIPVLEEYRLIQKIDKFVMEEVFSKYEHMLGKKENVVPVSINLSRLDFEVLDLVSFIDDIMKKYDCPKDMFHFEVTESAIMENSNLIMRQVERLREKGYIVWMDDFGSGYSSLNVLKNFKIDQVKIDMDFLAGFNANDNGKIILKHIVSMVKNLNIHTLAEGVETQEQLEFLKSIGCEMIQGYLVGRPLPFLEGQKILKDEGYELESYDERRFYESLGLVDILKQNPLQNIENQLLENPLPLAIGVVRDGIWHYVYSNKDYREEIKIYGKEDIVFDENLINDTAEWHWIEYKHFWDICQQSKKNHSLESMDYIDNGKIVNMKIKHIYEDKKLGWDAYIVSLKIMSNYFNEGYDKKFSEISRHIFSFYECVDLFGIHNDYFENIYLYDSRLHIEYFGKSSREIINMIADDKVHQDDRESFIKFMDLDTIEERVSKEKLKILTGFFRIKKINTQYTWKTVNVSLVKIDGRQCMLAFVSESNKKISDQMDNYVRMSEKLAKKDIKSFRIVIDKVMEYLPVSIFWKDKERRFAGANNMFLEYFGLKSFKELEGKKGEETGWYEFPEKAVEAEMQVVNEGRVVIDEYINCRARGRLRTIVYSKVPYIVNGNIVGMIGYFKDVTESLAKNNRLERLSISDPLTGLYNRRGFERVIREFVEEYDNEGKDFALYLIDVDKFKSINDMYGHDFGDKVLKKISNLLLYMAGDKGAVCRFGGDEFVILYPYKENAEIESFSCEIKNQVSKIKKIDSLDIKLRLSIGVAIYSESKSIIKTVDLADRRMYLEKDQNRKNK